jgi:ABC-2 type transport system ATP-binding protein
MELTAKHMTKSIGGNQILSDVCLQLRDGKIYGFVGRNGSGKTMLFRGLSGLMHIDSGTVCLDDKCLHRDFSIIPNLGIVLEHVSLYPDLTGMENLAYLAKIRRRIGVEEIKKTLLRVGLDPADQRVYRKYSLGMKQRLAIAQAVMEQPDVIMLDEPTNGLDEDGVDKIRTLILEEKQRGAMILLASHNREDIQILADELYRVEAGKIFKWEGEHL